MRWRGWSRASRSGIEVADTPDLFSLAPCQNCGDPADGKYCRTCGQHKIDHRRSVLALMSDTVEDFSLTSELPRTVRALITRPGFLTNEYSAGRIARYIPPVRLYLAASLLFFLTLQLVSRHDVAPGTAPAPAGVTRDSAGAATPKPASDSAKSKTARKPRNFKLDHTPFPALNKRLKEAGDRLKKLPPGEAQKRLKDFMIQRAPMMMFLLLPLFALLTKLFFWGARRYYTEHLVFALHTHATAFLAFTLQMLLPGNGSWRYPALALFGGVIFYQLFAMKRVFEQGWIRTTFKWATIGMIYFALFITAITAEAIAAFLFV